MPATLHFVIWFRFSLNFGMQCICYVFWQLCIFELLLKIIMAFRIDQTILKPFSFISVRDFGSSVAKECYTHLFTETGNLTCAPTLRNFFSIRVKSIYQKMWLLRSYHKTNNENVTNFICKPNTIITRCKYYMNKHKYCGSST